MSVNGKHIGTLTGYDLTHFLNHMNIVIKITGELYIGWEAGLKPGAPITFTFTQGQKA